MGTLCLRVLERTAEQLADSSAGRIQFTKAGASC